MGANPRTKGHGWEREVARRLQEAMPGCGSRRDFQTQQNHERPDVTHPFLWIECKAMKQCNPRAALAQALECCPEEKYAVAICKDDRKPPYVMLQLDDFEELMALIWIERQGNR